MTTLPNCQKANFKNPHSDPGLDMADEMTRFSEADKIVLLQMFEERFQANWEILEYAREVSMPEVGYETIGVT